MATQAIAAETGHRGARLNSDIPQLIIGVIVVAATTFIPDIAGNPYWTHSFQLVNLFICAAVFQNLLMHDAGQASFGQSAIFGMSAYMAAIATGMHGLNYGIGMVIGVLASVVGGLLFAGPALRVQGYYLGFVTLSAATVFPELLIALNKYTNGINGISIPFPTWHKEVFGLSMLSLVIVGVTCASLAFHVWLRSTGFGRAMRIAAASPEAAQSLGINTGLMRCLAFTIVSAGTGVAGLLYPPIVGFVSPSAFNLEISIVFFLAVIVGGRGQILGPIVGVWILYLLPNVLLVELVNFRLLAYGTLALVVMLLFSDGLIGSFERWRLRRNQSTQRVNIHLDGLLGPVRTVGARAPRTEVAIDVKKARKTFGSVIAVDDVDMQVMRAEIHGLVGANGSGKTSLLNVFNGFSRLNAGSVTINGADITRLSSNRIAKLGIGRTFQTPRIFNAMSLWENLEIGLDANTGKSVAPADVLAAMKASMGEQSVDLVPHGQRRMIEVMRAVLMGADVLFLDEPAAGLSPGEREEFKNLLRRLRDEMGKTIVLVEHDLQLVWDVADRITVLEAGKMVASGSPTEIAGNPSVRKLFIEPTHA